MSQKLAFNGWSRLLIGSLLLGGTAIADQDSIGWWDMYGGLTVSQLPLATPSSAVVFDDGSGPALYVGGSFERAGGIPITNFARWRQRRWEAVGAGYPQGKLSGMAVFDDGSGPALYLGGVTSVNGTAMPGMAKWNGIGWEAVGDGLVATYSVGPVYTIYVFDDGNGAMLYAGGGFRLASDPNVRGFARLRDGHWEPVGAGFTAQGTLSPLVGAMTTYDNGTGPALYVGGFFSRIGSLTVNNVARWNGSQWEPLAAGVSTPPSILLPFINVFIPGVLGGQNVLFAGGAMESPSRALVAWNGQSWLSVGHGTYSQSSSPPSISSMAYFDDGRGMALYACGRFSSFRNVNTQGIVRYDGQGWSAVGDGLSSMFGSGGEPDGMRVLKTFDDGLGPALFVGGRFSEADSRPVACFARLGPIPGDMNCDGSLNQFDINPFVLALQGGDAYQQQFPDCNVLRADANADGSVNQFDIAGFLRLMGG